ncbi:DUF6350 family protein [Frondihabitans australicus]|uniref:Uncharacterized protein n=1 Tax=Frondihabitans australicus TaxID=386892 RepID=A0A495IIB9_9MICO|nr:DUF6350 family protein [Frondihabitans australicus]RKR75450.1 hypothetical protein C8E83_2598 [Frondihabitans australicus]
MNRPVTAVFAALESLLVAGIGVGIPVVALTFLWAFQYGLQVDWSVFWRAGADIWLVGHGVDLTLTLSAKSAAATGITGAGAPMLISIAALGFALLTVVLGARTGRRLAETRHRAIGSVSAIAVFAVLAAVVTLTAEAPGAHVSVAQGVAWPTIVYGVPLLAAAEVTRRRRGAPADPVTFRILSLIDRVPVLGREVALVSLRAGSAIAAAVMAIAGVIVALLLVTHYASIISLYEGAHAGVVGGVALTLGQVALIPNAVAWAASWLVGPGFALGTGSAVSPLGTTIGPMPAIPFLGALPTGSPTFGFIGILVPVVAAFVVTTLLRPDIERALGRNDTMVGRVVAGAATGVTGGLVVGLLVAAASGSAGPGRLATVGANGLVVGAFAALEIGVPAMLALVVRQPQRVSDLQRRAGGSGSATSGGASSKPRAKSPHARDQDDVVTERIPGLKR